MHEVNDYIESIENAKQKAVFEHLHELLISFPGMKAKLRFKIPFYDCRHWVCYLNPTKTGETELAFCRANEMSNEQGLLDFRGRKQVAGAVFSSVADIPEGVLLEVIAEALLVDETKYASKRKAKGT